MSLSLSVRLLFVTLVNKAVYRLSLKAFTNRIMRESDKTNHFKEIKYARCFTFLVLTRRSLSSQRKLSFDAF